MKIYIFAIWLLFTCDVFAEDVISSNGYRDYVFGLSYEAAKDLNPSAKKGETMVFGEEPMIELRFSEKIDGENTDISVRFKNNRISIIVLNFPVDTDEQCGKGYNAFKSKLNSTFGHPSRTRKGPALYWSLEKGASIELSAQPCVQGERMYSIVLKKDQWS